MRKLLFCSVLLAGLTGCARDANLYPLNATGPADAGIVKAQFMSYGVGHGSITATMPDGEILKGEYDVSLGGSASFGSIYAQAYGSGGYASGSGTMTALAMPNSSTGEAVLVGNRGTSMQCEFLNNNWTGKGHGACKSSKGAIYKVMY